MFAEYSLNHIETWFLNDSDLLHERFDIYDSAFRKVPKSGKAAKVIQEHFHQVLKLAENNGMNHWRANLN